MLNKLVLGALGMALTQPSFSASLDLQTSQERFSSSARSMWHSSEISYHGDSFGMLTRWGATLSDDIRYGSRATGVQVYFVRNVAQHFAVEARVIGAEGADFLPKKGIEATIYTGLPLGLELTGSVGRRVYAQDSTTLLRGQLDREFGPWRVGVGLSQDLTSRVNTMSYSAKYTTKAGSWGLRLADGRESNRAADGAVTIEGVRVAVLEGVYAIQPTMSIRGCIYRTLTDASRTGVSLGLSHKF